MAYKKEIFKSTAELNEMSKSELIEHAIYLTEEFYNMPYKKIQERIYQNNLNDDEN